MHDKFTYAGIHITQHYYVQYFIICIIAENKLKEEITSTIGVCIGALLQILYILKYFGRDFRWILKIRNSKNSDS